MKTFRSTMAIALVLFAMLFTGCIKDNPQVPAESILVSAIIFSYGNPTDATSISVGLNNMNSTDEGHAITGAIVKVNGIKVDDKGSGAYTLLLTDNPITAGTNVTLNVTWGDEKISVSAVMPGSGQELKVDVPGAYPGSYLALSNNN